jgi:Putative Ig domain
VNATGGVQPYNWSTSTSGRLPSGLTLSSSGTISGTPTGTGTSSFTVSVSDSENPMVTVSANLSISVNAGAACANNSTLSGGYAMMLGGWSDSSFGNLFGGVVGSFYADGNGNITEGMVDMNSWFGPERDTFTGTYCISPTNFNLGTMTINPATNPNPRTLAFSLQSDGNGKIIFFDANANFCSGCGLGGFHGSGVLRKQQTSPFSTSEINGTYAFGFSGANGGAPSLAEAGVIATDGNGNITSGEYDFNSGGAIATGTIVPAGSVYSVESTGRGTATIISTTSSPVSLVFYVVSPSEVLFLQDNAPAVTGQGLLQSGSFNNSSLSGNMVIGIEDGEAEAEAGVLNADGSGSFTYSMDVNSNGTWGSAPGSGTYLVASNGRVQLSSMGTSGAAPVLYLVSQNKALLVGTDASASFGKIEPQLGSNFTNASLNGNFTGGSEQTAGPAVGEEVDSVNFYVTAGTVMGADDQNAENNAFQYSPSSNVAICPANSCIYSVSSNGRVVVTNGVQQTIIYMISPSQFIVLTTGLGNMSNLTNPSTNPYLVDFSQ